MLPDRSLADALEPKVTELLDRHLSTTKEWFPHELVPWERGAVPCAEEPWAAEQVAMPAGVRSSLFVNLLTEDNLPYYFATIDHLFGSDGSWGQWARRWTAEEGRHSIVIRDYLTVTRAVDPVALERARMHQVSNGVVPRPPGVMDGLAYVALQELATRVAHRNTGKALADPAGTAVMARVAADENLHHLFYRDLVSEAFTVDPSAAMCAVERQVRDFEMPGTGIVGFSAHARAIAQAGIYDLRLHHDLILVPVVLRHWRVEDVAGLDAAGEQAREQLLSRVARIGRAGERLAQRMAERAAEEPALATSCA